MRTWIDRLEPRTLFAAVYPTPAEQYLVALINRARANPTAEVTRLAANASWNGATPDLNEGLPAGTITTDAKQPLAVNPFLTDAAHKHSVWMDANTFDHNEGTATPGDRSTAAGYPANRDGFENISTYFNGGAADLAGLVMLNHNQLFIDSGIAGRGHRAGTSERRRRSRSRSRRRTWGPTFWRRGRRR